MHWDIIVPLTRAFGTICVKLRLLCASNVHREYTPRGVLPAAPPLRGINIHLSGRRLVGVVAAAHYSDSTIEHGECNVRVQFRDERAETGVIRPASRREQYDNDNSKDG